MLAIWDSSGWSGWRSWLPRFQRVILQWFKLVSYNRNQFENDTSCSCNYVKQSGLPLGWAFGHMSFHELNSNFNFWDRVQNTIFQERMFWTLPSHFSRPRFPDKYYCVNMALSAGGSDNAGEYMTHGSLVLSTSYKQNDQKDNTNGH